MALKINQFVALHRADPVEGYLSEVIINIETILFVRLLDDGRCEIVCTPDQFVRPVETYDQVRLLLTGV